MPENPCQNYILCVFIDAVNAMIPELAENENFYNHNFQQF